MDALKRNNVKSFGHGRPIIFAHGFGCDQKTWEQVYPDFTKDHQVVVFDHVGSGGSALSAYDVRKYSTLSGYAEDAIEIIEAMGLQECIFVGHSVSAMIGVLAANRKHSLFSRLVLIGPSPCYINKENYSGGFNLSDLEGLLESLDSIYLGPSAAMAPVIMGGQKRPELGEKLMNSFCRTTPEIAKHFARVSFLSDHRKDLAACSVPALILQCSEDTIAPVVVGRYVAEHLQQGHFHQMKATGHCPNLSAPKETIAAIRSYLRR